MQEILLYNGANASCGVQVISLGVILLVKKLAWVVSSNLLSLTLILINCCFRGLLGGISIVLTYLLTPYLSLSLSKSEKISHLGPPQSF